MAYDPLDYNNLARSVVEALLGARPSTIPPDAFDGSGVYAIYYAGSLEYRATASAEEVPIYVGKAIPPGGRRGGRGDGPAATRPLHRRLRDHAKSIGQTTNLSLEHASCRHLVVVPVWINLAERFLIDHFKPLWNTVLDGFGNHDPGRGRRNSARPRWDIMHPGRAWATRLRASESREDILAAIQVQQQTESKHPTFVRVP